MITRIAGGENAQKKAHEVLDCQDGSLYTGIAIETKANDRRIPQSSRCGLLLALDATRLPALGFDAVVEAFRNDWGLWTKSLGFDSVWLIGPSESMTWRLDK